MSYTPNNNFTAPVQGEDDWDATWNANLDVIDRGYHGKFTALSNINTGDILYMAFGGGVTQYDPRSFTNRWPVAMSYKAVSSGEVDTFLLRGIVSSVGVWSGNITPGRPVYASPSSLGRAVGSYSAAFYPAGLALRDDAIYFNPGVAELPEKITDVQTLGPLAIGSTHSFTLSIGNRGFIRRVSAVTSFNLWELKLWSGSARVSSELVFQTVSGGVSSTGFLDAAGFPYENTDVASPGIMFGSVTVSSGVSSGYFGFSIVAERLR